MFSHRLMPVLIGAGLWLLLAAAPAAADDAWTGETTTGINLRRAPGLSGAVITALEDGERLTVLQQRGDWLQVAVDGDGYGFRGWVFGRYVRPLADAPPPPVEIRAPLQATVPDPGEAVAPPPSPPQPAAVQQQPAAPVAPSTVDPRAAVPPAPEKTEPALPGAQAAPSASPQPPVSVPRPAPTAAAVLPSMAEPSTESGQTAPVASTMTDAPALPKTAAAVRASPPQTTPAATKPDPGLAAQTPAAPDKANAVQILALVLRLATTVLACMALIIALRAHRLALVAATATASPVSAPTAAGQPGGARLASVRA